MRLARIETTYGNHTHNDAANRPQSLDDLERLQPDDIFKKLYQNKYQAEPNAELLAAFAELLTADREIAP